MNNGQRIASSSSLSGFLSLFSVHLEGWKGNITRRLGPLQLKDFCECVQSERESRPRNR
jgi:hypothetical protein